MSLEPGVDVSQTVLRGNHGIEELISRYTVDGLGRIAPALPSLDVGLCGDDIIVIEGVDGGEEASCDVNKIQTHRVGGTIVVVEAS